MSGPINALRFVHAAILKEVKDLEERAFGPLTADDAKAMAKDLEFFHHLMDGHTKGEEVGLFPPLAEIESQLAQTYLRDHDLERAMFKELAAGLEKVAGGDESARDDVRRTAAALRHHASAHIGKENELILPFVAEHFDPPKQGEILGKILSVFTPADMEPMLPWIVARLDDETATNYIGVLEKVQPPEAYKAACGWIKAGIPEDQRARLAEGIEGLR